MLLSGLGDDSPVRWRFAESAPVEPTAAETEVTASWLISGMEFIRFRSNFAICFTSLCHTYIIIYV